MVTSSPPSLRSTPFPWTVVLLAALAGAASGALAGSMVQGEPIAGPSTQAAAGDVLARLDHLERRLAQAVAVPPLAAGTVAEIPLREVPAGSRDDDVQRRLAAIEKALQESTRPAPAPAARADGAVRDQPASDAAEQLRRIATHQQAILDPRLDDKQRLQAWGQLRHLPDSWNDAVVATMAHLGQTSTDPAVRADVWRQADGRSTHPAMGQALLLALQTDAHADAREEAAETLENYLDLPGVRQALEAAAANDADEGVRRQAQQVLRPRSR